MAEKPILFNTEMVKAILDGRKTQTRRLVKPQPVYNDGMWELGGAGWGDYHIPIHPVPGHSLWERQPVKPGDILWVRETWFKDAGRFMYRANYSDTEKFYMNGREIAMRWCPSIHMPREAARLFLWVNRVWMERLQEIMDTPPGPDNPIVKEGCTYGFEFIAVWDKTIKPAERPLYGWDANPWVWVIEFERLDEKPAGLWADRDAAQYADQDVLMPAI